jgi:DNA repair exonuclease SbcCD ATPase subunit
LSEKVFEHGFFFTLKAGLATRRVLEGKNFGFSDGPLAARHVECNEASPKMNEKENKVRALEAQIQQLQRQWPKHSVPPALMQELDELEDALAEARAQLQERAQNEPAP